MSLHILKTRAVSIVWNSEIPEDVLEAILDGEGECPVDSVVLGENAYAVLEAA
jgi:hypothetical protein